MSYAAPSYAALWTKSAFSFLEGASHPEELVETAARLGLPALALTDRDGVYGAVEGHVAARKTGIQIIHGSEVTLDDATTLVLLATDREGYGNLCRLISRGRLRCEKGESKITWQEVCEYAPGLIALWGGRRSLIVDPADPFFIAQMLKDAFGDRLYALAARHRLAIEAEQEARLRTRARRFQLPVVAAIEVLYHLVGRKDLQDVLTVLRHRTTLSQAGRLTTANAEHRLKSSSAFRDLFADDPAAVARTLEIAERCSFSLDQIRYRYPAEELPDGETSTSWLRRLTFDGARERYDGEVPVDVAAQLEKELDLIEELDYDGYFLTMWEIVQFCRRNGILCQGRGSAANSAVCYCLGVTAVDPVRMGLLFERFLSRERAEPPDIDLDIEHNRREEAIQFVYARYGRERAAMVANVVRYRTRSAVRDVGKALGLPATELDRLAKLLPYYGGVEADAFRQAGFNPNNPTYGHLLRLSQEIQDFPRHLSIHPGGFLLGDQPVDTVVPIENATMEDRTVIQWDKDSLEELGLFKVDLLGLGALHQLHLGFDLLREHKREEWSMATIPEGDAATYEMIQRADTVGTFQIESRAQMSMLPRLKPKDYYDLVVEVSIVRPGPITGGMVHPYLRRRNGGEPITYPHPSLEPVLAKTLGVPLFQEQVIRLAMVAADYSPGEADQLRRDMAAWRRSGRIERHRARLIERMTAKGIEPEFAERVFEQIRGFGEYGFPESHAASFALIAYATAWMKRHHPEVFLCSILNAQPMGFYSASTLVEDARRHGVKVRPMDVLASCWDCTLEPADDTEHFAVRMGMRYLKGLRREDWERAETRIRDGTLVDSVEDFVRCASLDERTVTRLAKAGAFETLEDHRRLALWRSRGAARTTPTALPLTDREASAVLEPVDDFIAIGWDYQTSRHSARGHPLEPVREVLAGQGLPPASEVNTLADGRRARYAGMVICRQRPGTASGVVFMTLEDETGFVNVVIWAQVFERFAALIKTTQFLGVSGRLQAQDGVVHLIAEEFWTPQIDARPESGGSRDFH